MRLFLEPAARIYCWLLVAAAAGCASGRVQGTGYSDSASFICPSCLAGIDMGDVSDVENSTQTGK